MIDMTKKDKIELKLIDEVKKGNKESFEKIVELYKNRIFSYIYKFVNHKQLAEEITMDVFVKVYFNISSYDADKGKFSTWLYKICYNTTINEIKKNKKDRVTYSFNDVSEEYLSIEKYNLDRIIENEDQSYRLNKLIESLPKKYSQILNDFYIKGLKCEEISEITHVPVNTVKTRLKRARDMIRKEYDYV